jgi:GR25 family glycosyltransferase involved in LPS biosynthesis
MLGGIIVINMEKRPDRLSRLLGQISQSDLSTLPVYRLIAHDGSKLDYRQPGLLTPQAVKEMDMLNITKVRDFHAQLSIGAIGCYLSHVDAWKYISDLEKDVPTGTPFLVLEDDATVSPVMKARIIDAWNIAKASGEKPFILLVHVICLSGCAASSTGLQHPERFWSTQAYCIDGKSAGAMLRAGMFPIDVQIDSQIQYFRNAGVLNVFAASIFKNGSSDTDIQVNIRPHAPLDRPVKTYT